MPETRSRPKHTPKPFVVDLRFLQTTLEQIDSPLFRTHRLKAPHALYSSEEVQTLIEQAHSALTQASMLVSRARDMEAKAREHFCPRCGGHYITHNGDGSCVRDD